MILQEFDYCEQVFKHVEIRKTKEGRVLHFVAFCKEEFHDMCDVTYNVKFDDYSNLEEAYYTMAQMVLVNFIGRDRIRGYRMMFASHLFKLIDNKEEPCIINLDIIRRCIDDYKKGLPKLKEFIEASEKHKQEKDNVNKKIINYT